MFSKFRALRTTPLWFILHRASQLQYLKRADGLPGATLWKEGPPRLPAHQVLFPLRRTKTQLGVGLLGPTARDTLGENVFLIHAKTKQSADILKS